MTQIIIMTATGAKLRYTDPTEAADAILTLVPNQEKAVGLVQTLSAKLARRNMTNPFPIIVNLSNI